MRTNLLRMVSALLTVLFLCTGVNAQNIWDWKIEQLPLCGRFDKPVPYFPETNLYEEWSCSDGGSVNSGRFNPYDWRDPLDQVAVTMNYDQWFHTGVDTSGTGYVQMRGVEFRPEVDTFRVRAQVLNRWGHLGYYNDCDPPCIRGGPGTMTVWVRILEHATGEELFEQKLEELFEHADTLVEELGEPGEGRGVRMLFSLVEADVLRSVGLLDIEFGFYYESELRSGAWIWHMSEIFDQFQNADGTSVRTEDLVSASDVRLEAYPNPTRDVLNIEIEGFTQPHLGLESSLVLYDLLGREVARVAISAAETRIDVSRLPSGAYVVVLQDKRGLRLGVKRITVI